MRPTKNGKKRKGKATCTKARFQLRQTFWNVLKKQLQQHLKSAPKGAALEMARTIGIDPSDVHGFTCPICEHDREPNFSVGMALLMYLSSYKFKQTAIPAPSLHKKRNRPDVQDEVIDQIIQSHYNQLHPIRPRKVFPTYEYR